MARMTDLPNELLFRIIHFLHIDSPKTLPAVSESCKHLHQPAHEVLFKDINLTWKFNKVAQIAKFVKVHQGNDVVRSIRLSPGTAQLNAFKMGIPSAYQHFDALCACLSSLPNLRTLSLCLEMVDRWRMVPTKVLVGIVRALPASTENLELDTRGANAIMEKRGTRDTSGNNLCAAISDILPQLVTLRLRVSHLCADLSRSLDQAADGTQPTSKLRRAAIEVDVSPFDFDFNSSGSASNAYYPVFRHDHGGMRAAPPSPEKLFTHFLHQRSCGAFPFLERFLIRSRSAPNEDELPYLRVRDVMTRVMTHHPFVSARPPASSVEEEKKDRGDYVVVKVQGNRDFAGWYEVVETGLMSGVAWEDGPTGERMPPDVKAELDAEYRPDLGALKDAEGFDAEESLTQDSKWYKASEWYTRLEE
ncbi:hypothetical protein K458DRAFT_418867 [Lentithecium fluviatile CBS 122367]|uniref:F-box domain-containing protein n=1 Tax=Lentithecium fluviatile CBS 122367 TaxID=1168545 RepID=A0A6G1J0Z8_9PLEO|nr:hypothetical protein K458DRAFT_418867 [Lentithecium fluviatile CBS 122367]